MSENGDEYLQGVKIKDLPTWAEHLAVAVMAHVDTAKPAAPIDCVFMRDVDESEEEFWVIALYPPVIDRDGKEHIVNFEQVSAAGILEEFDDPSDTEIRDSPDIVSFDGTFRGRLVTVEIYFRPMNDDEDAPRILVYSSTTIH